MDMIQQRIIEIAQQIPDYVGYQEKERRRDANELVRRQLAAKYDEQRARLARLQRQAPLSDIVALENLDQKLLRLIERFRTATGGYAGWFDAAQIGASDLDQLTQFDASLADGVNTLKAKLDALAAALKTKTGLDDAVDACAESLDALNAQYDQREQFVSLGKKPSPSSFTIKPPASPLGALETKQAPPPELTTLANLKMKDAVSYGGADYIIAGKITYSASAGFAGTCLAGPAPFQAATRRLQVNCAPTVGQAPLLSPGPTRRPPACSPQARGPRRCGLRAASPASLAR